MAVFQTKNKTTFDQAKLGSGAQVESKSIFESNLESADDSQFILL